METYYIVSVWYLELSVTWKYMMWLFCFVYLFWMIVCLSSRMALMLEHDLMELHSKYCHQLHLVFQQMLHNWQPWQVIMLHSLKKRAHSWLEAVMEDIPFGRWCGCWIGMQRASSNREQGGGRWHPTSTNICIDVFSHPNVFFSFRHMSVSGILVIMFGFIPCVSSIVYRLWFCLYNICVQNYLSVIPN